MPEYQFPRLFEARRQTRHHLWAGFYNPSYNYQRELLTLIPREFKDPPSSDEVFVLFWEGQDQYIRGFESAVTTFARQDCTR